MVACFAISGPVHAATVNVDYDMELSYLSETGVRENTGTYRQDLIGMDMTAVYTDGTVETWDWIQLGQYNFGTDHVSEDLTIDFQTSFDPITSSFSRFRMDVMKRLASFTVDLTGANAIWDAGEYADSDERNSPTTKIGREFDILVGNDDSLPGTIAASYSDRVQIGDHLTGEDAFTRLVLDFSGLQDGGFLGDFAWRADTDILAADGALAPVVPAVPLPAGGLLLLTAFGAFSLMRRKNVLTATA